MEFFELDEMPNGGQRCRDDRGFGNGSRRGNGAGHDGGWRCIFDWTKGCDGIKENEKKKVSL